MSSPIARAGALPPPLPPYSNRVPKRNIPIEQGDSALTAPTTPSKRVAVVDKDKVNPQLRDMAEQFEGMFLDFMMKVMRESVPKEEGSLALRNQATEIYEGMLDHEYSQKAVKAGGVGLADQIIAYLQPDLYTLGKEPKAPPPRQRMAPVDDPTVKAQAATVHTGGTHEGQLIRK